jgi:NADH:ubiquinone oxidoreductase subunit 2 (subunit N)
MSKWQIFAGSVEPHNIWVSLVVIFAALNSVLSLGYYAPLVNRMYRRSPSVAVLAGKPVPALMAVPVIVLLALVVVIGFYPALIQGLIQPAAQNFVSMFGGQPFMAGR